MASVYQGKATIVEVDGSDLKDYQKKGLTEEQAEAGFNLEIRVKPADENYGECVIEVEISQRECAGKMAGKIQQDISLETLLRQKLISAAKIDNVEEVFGKIGTVVEVYQKERSYKTKDGAEKTVVDTYFSSGFRLSQDTIKKRLAMLSGAKSGGSAARANPFD